MKPVLVIADDLTGAADTGVCFTRAGLSAAVAFSAEDSPAADVLVFTTESRSAGECAARQRTRDLIRSVPDSAILYKKIDSTLRGFPGPELAEILIGLGVEKVLIAPAFPAQGRTTVAGRQLINGLPIEHTSFQREVALSDLVQLFGVCARPIRSVSLAVLRSSPAELQQVFAGPGPLAIIADAETDLDLQILAQAAFQNGIRLFCGSAGLAAALADRFPHRPPSPGVPPFPRRNGPVLVVAGSRNPVTIQQVKTARTAGLDLVEWDPDLETLQIQASERLISAVHALLASGRDVILTTSSSKDSPLGPIGVAGQLAQWVSSLTAAHEIGGLVITGGEVAMAVISSLHATGVRLWGEFLSGIPYGTLLGGNQPSLPVLTKAGGFGNQDVLLKAVQFLGAALES
jgi:uncharacterized protein YgbK (DUF1537 family)